MNPTRPNLNSWEYQRQAIDAQIKSLEDEDSIRALRLQRNALAPISSLPPEIFATIFSFLPHMLSSIKPRKMLDPLAWLRYSHVCHQWREIALNQPLLWCRVNFTNISLVGAAQILARAKMAPLHLEARGLGDHWDDNQFGAFQDELQFRVSRIRHFLILANPQRLRKALEGLVSPALTLESLSLSSEAKQPRTVVPETLFGGTTPRLSRLELSNCNISWESSLLKGLRCLEIRSPAANTRPSLPVWLGALNEMQQLKRLTLYSASPIAPPIPVEVERTVTLPFFTHLDISSSAKNCALVLAHLDLPALTWLCVGAIVHLPDLNDIRRLVSYVARHAHGPQDTQPLQSALVLAKGKYIDILAWTTPDIDDDTHDTLTLLPTTLPTRVALSLTSKGGDWNYRSGIGTACMVIAALPLDNLVTFVVKDAPYGGVFLPKSQRWALLRRVRLNHDACEFLDWLEDDEGGCENPLLPSLKELVLVDNILSKYMLSQLHGVQLQRVEQGVPLEMLDLSTCCPDPDYYADSALSRLDALNHQVDDVLYPEETVDARAQIVSTWDGLTCGPFVGHEDDNSDTSSDEDDEE